MNRSLTIVLPVHNGESRLHCSVDEMLELGSELTRDFSVLIVDDGSTDDTPNVAANLASRYPQVHLYRSRTRQGIDAIVRMARRQLTSDLVVVHDGVTPIDTVQIRQLWQQCTSRPDAFADLRSPGVDTTMDNVRDFTGMAASHMAMAEAHQRVLGFQLLEPKRAVVDRRVTESDINRSDRSSQSSRNERPGVGQIPPPPRPKFLSALANFALGE